MNYYWSGYGKQPSHAHQGDAGFDLSYHGIEPLTIAPHTTTNIPTGIRVALPSGMWAIVTGRSSTFQRGLLTPMSIIDNGYRGDLFAIVHNMSDKPVTIVPQERIAQLIPMQLHTDGVEWHHLDELPTDTSRGTNGFGSSGQL